MPAFAGLIPGGPKHYSGRNHRLIAAAVFEHVRHGDVVADVTYGKGYFWRGVPTWWFDLMPSDIDPRRPGVSYADFTDLPYADASIDVVVFDPPYLVNAGPGMFRGKYRLDIAAGLSFEQVMTLYVSGIAEAYRVLKPGGLLWVKGLDQDIYSFETAILDTAVTLGFGAVDRYTFQRLGGIKGGGRPSFLLIFEKAQAHEAAVPDVQ